MTFVVVSLTINNLFRTWLAVAQIPELCSMEADMNRSDPNITDINRSETNVAEHTSFSQTFLVGRNRSTGHWKFKFNTDFCHQDNSLPYSFPVKAFHGPGAFDLNVYWWTNYKQQTTVFVQTVHKINLFIYFIISVPNKSTHDNNLIVTEKCGKIQTRTPYSGGLLRWRQLVRAVPTPDTATVCKICKSK